MDFTLTLEITPPLPALRLTQNFWSLGCLTVMRRPRAFLPSAMLGQNFKAENENSKHPGPHDYKNTQIFNHEP